MKKHCNHCKKPPRVIYNQHPDDNEVQHKFYSDKLEAAELLGYESFKKAVVDLYRIHQSTIKVADIMGMTSSGIWRLLNVYGVSRRGRGGFYGRRGETVMRKCKHHGFTEFYKHGKKCCVKCQSVRWKRWAKKTGKR